MVLRIAALISIVLALVSGALAQADMPRWRPEKYSTRPIPAPLPSGVAAAVVYSPWTKFCGKPGNNPQAKEVCLTVKEARLSSGEFVAGATLVEQADNERKLFRISLPPNLRGWASVRLFVGRDALGADNTVRCAADRCFADFEANADLISKLMNSQHLQLQSTDVPGQVATYLLPLDSFAKTFRGPPTVPKEFRVAPQNNAPR